MAQTNSLVPLEGKKKKSLTPSQALQISCEVWREISQNEGKPAKSRVELNQKVHDI